MNKSLYTLLIIIMGLLGSPQLQAGKTGKTTFSESGEKEDCSTATPPKVIRGHLKDDSSFRGSRSILIKGFHAAFYALFDVQEKDTVGDLKQKIYKRFQIPTDQQELSYGGKMLSNEGDVYKFVKSIFASKKLYICYP